MENTIQITKKQLEDIADILYKGHTSEGLAMMGEVIPSIAAISQLMDEDAQGRLMNKALQPALEAMEDGDGTLLADIISYEFIEFLDELER